jgi:hypothetical protein
VDKDACVSSQIFVTSWSGGRRLNPRIAKVIANMTSSTKTDYIVRAFIRAL